MPETGAIRPLLQKGALVQLVNDVIGVVPNIVVFQYNPEQLARTIAPWNPFEVDQTRRGAQSPQVQPVTPSETINLAIELDATDALEEGRFPAIVAGVADRLAALKKLVLPTQGLIGDLMASAAALTGNASREAVRPTVPVLLFVWGPGRILPVRITSFSVEETQFSPLLYPTQAKVSLTLEVLTPDVFKCQGDTAAKLAIAAYNATRLQEDALAIANVANNVDAIRSLLPF